LKLRFFDSRGVLPWKIIEELSLENPVFDTHVLLARSASKGRRPPLLALRANKT
jgi:hypothetical protein